MPGNQLLLKNYCVASRALFQKNPRVRKICVRNSGAGNGCANFMDAWKNAFFLQEKPMSIKFLVLGGGGLFGVLGGGGGVPILFFWARGFFWKMPGNQLLLKNYCVASRALLRLCAQPLSPTTPHKNPFQMLRLPRPKLSQLGIHLHVCGDPAAQLVSLRIFWGSF